MAIDFWSVATFAWISLFLFGLGAATPKIEKLLKTIKLEAWATPISLLFTLAGSLYAFIMGLGAWLGKVDADSVVFLTSSWAPTSLPALTWQLRIDALSALFLLLIGFFAILVSIYSLAALKASYYRKYRTHIAGGFNLFVWGSLMVVIVNDIFSLIVVLEVATLSFAILTLYKSRRYETEAMPREDIHFREARLAPMIYLTFSHASTTLLLAGLMLLAVRANSLSFDALRYHVAQSATPLNSVAFWLILSGLALRAGLTPFHIWPPLVHPASPTTTHAFSLGIGIKVAIFLMYRIFFQFLHLSPWWGLAVFLLGAFTAMINVWYALTSHDLKTGLAYHSIENIGIIVAGLGLAMFGYQSHHPFTQSIAALALVASLYHLINHSIFKGLLYLVTGAIEDRTKGVVDFARLGGVLRFYPLTGIMFLMGALAISGFPPFNGFISEWLLVRANIGSVVGYVMSHHANDILWRELGILVTGFVLLAASFALTAVCFYKMAGLTLFGRQSTDIDWKEDDVPWQMVGPMAILALLILILGLFPKIVISELTQVTLSLSDTFISVVSTYKVPVQIAFSGGKTTNVPISSGAFLGMVISVLAFSGFFLWQWRRRVNSVPMWRGGLHISPEQIRLTRDPGTASTWLIRNALKYLSVKRLQQDKDEEQSEQQKLPERGYIPDQIIMAKGFIEEGDQIVSEAFRWTLNRLAAKTISMATIFGFWMQSGDVRRYITYILLADALALIFFVMSFLYLSH